jgi:hypothetical protein
VIGVHQARLALLLPLLAACSGESSGTPAAGGAAPSGTGQGGVAAAELPYEPCSADSSVGQFVIELGMGFTRVGGRVTDAVLPSRVPDELAGAGECRLLAAAPTSCVPACPAATQVCDRDEACVPLPRAHDVGAITVHGLVVPLQISPNAVTRGYSNPAQPPLPHPGFLPGADLRLDSAGGDYAPFELRGWGVSALALDGAPIEVRGGRATPIRWQAPSVSGPARLHVELNINQHGATSSSIECDFPDTGAAEIPAELVDGLIGQGLSGDPTLTATRRSATSIEIEPGCVEMLVVSELTVDVQVEGIVSCDSSSQCPAGQTCLDVERFCE